jgi:hypothetical protein
MSTLDCRFFFLEHLYVYYSIYFFILTLPGAVRRRARFHFVFCMPVSSNLNSPPVIESALLERHVSLHAVDLVNEACMLKMSTNLCWYSVQIFVCVLSVYVYETRYRLSSPRSLLIFVS